MKLNLLSALFTAILPSKLLCEPIINPPIEAFTYVANDTVVTGGTISANKPLRLASVSKQIVATLVFKAQEEGVLTLDDRLSKFFTSEKTSEFGNLSIRNLLAHTSGLYNPDDFEKSADGYSLFYTEKMDRSALCFSNPKASEIGKFNYNNCDYIVLQKVLEKAYGQGFSRILKEKISKPLGVKSLGIVTFKDPTEKPKNERFINLKNYGASGALYMSLSDLMKFDTALWNNKIIKEKSFSEMTKGNPEFGFAALGMWSYPMNFAKCNKTVDLVERRGEIGNVRILNLIAPNEKKALILYSTKSEDFGQLWQAEGTAFEAAQSIICEN